ncbi:MAG TPA: L-lactate dehydrogenase [Caulobacteraceae bacterium]|jgi:L-lactate dehydrogenase (cytochrome)|nr:L-lactate dehydrogenase [Caulobacteraceae bacterium]
MSNPVCIADYRGLARRRLPRMLFDYIDGGSGDELTLRRNGEALQAIRLRQRVMRDVSSVSLSTELFGERFSMPLLLGPVGLSGLYARRGEVQAARAAEAAGVTSCLSTLSVCSIEEVAGAVTRKPWFQLYMFKDRGYMRELLARVGQAGSPVLVFTVDLVVPGTRYRELRSGMSGPLAAWPQVRRAVDGAIHTDWLIDVMLKGRPHTLGNIAAAVPEARGADGFWTWVRQNLDASVTWDDLEWVRQHWKGPIVVKGVLDVEDARASVGVGVEGIVVSNHGGRQLDGTSASIEALPAIAAAAGDRTTVLMDGGVRSGQDVVKALALGARGCMLGRAWAYPLAARGGAGVAHALELLRGEIATALALTGCTDVKAAGHHMLAVD